MWHLDIGTSTEFSGSIGGQYNHLNLNMQSNCLPFLYLHSIGLITDLIVDLSLLYLDFHQVVSRRGILWGPGSIWLGRSTGKIVLATPANSLLEDWGGSCEHHSQASHNTYFGHSSFIFGKILGQSQSNGTPASGVLVDIMPENASLSYILFY